MRIIYGVHGYGRGHATRALSVLPVLARRHEVMVLAGGDAYEVLNGSFEVQRIPSLSFCYANGRRSTWLTLLRNAPLFLDLLTGAGFVRQALSNAKSFRPEVVISDAEPCSHRVGRLLGVPRISFDHFGVMVHCRVPLPLLDALRSTVDRAVYRLLMGGADRKLVSSFYRVPPLHGSVHVVAPLLRDEVHELRPRQGQHILAYFNQGAVQLTQPGLQALQSAPCEVRLYGTQQRGRSENVWFRPPDNATFLRDLANCRAVVSTAGNQLVGEAIRFGKPMLVFPENSVEQRLNAFHIVKLGIGEAASFGELRDDRVQQFLGRAHLYAKSEPREEMDGRREALDLIETWLADFAAQRRRPLCEVTA